MDGNELIHLIHSKHNPELAKLPGHVYQVWFDGEVTLQKSGELLNMRNLHTISPGLELTGMCSCWLLSKDEMPNSGGFAYVNKEDADEIRNAFGDYFINLIKLAFKNGK